MKSIVATAHQVDVDFGLLIEVLAVTGAEVEPGGAARGRRPPHRRQPSAADAVEPQGEATASYKDAAADPSPPGRRPGAAIRRSRPDQPLLTMGYFYARRRWVELGLDKAVTFYSLRHSIIVRELLANVLPRVVAAHHDTSVAMIEHTYSRHIGTVSDQVVAGRCSTPADRGVLSSSKSFTFLS